MFNNSRVFTLPFFLSIVALGVVCFQTLDPVADTFWHVRLGMDFLEKGLSPFVDHYSFTFADKPLTWVPWLADSIMYLFTKLGGDYFGLQIYLFVSFFVASFILLDILKSEKVSRFLQCFAVLVVAALFAGRREPRPETICMILLMLQLKLFFLNRHGFKSKTLWQFVLLQFVWTNFHTSSVLGYVIGFALFTDAGIAIYRDKLSSKNWSVWFAAGAASLVVGFLNHDFQHVLAWHLGEKENWASFISEYLPFSFAEASLPLGFLVVCFPYVAAASAFRKQLGELLVTTIFFYYGLAFIRMTPLYAIVTLPILIVNLQWSANAVHKWRPRLSKVIARSAAAITTLYFSWFFLGLMAFSPWAFEANFNPKYQPVDVVDYMIKSGKQGKIRNQLENGGYLLYRLGPGENVFFDGRTVLLYPFDFAKTAVTNQRDQIALKAEYEKYKYDFVIADLANSDLLFEHALELGLFKIEFVGEHFALLSKSQSQFPVGSRLLRQPHCIEATDLPQIENELSLSSKILPAGSPLRMSLDISKKFFKNESLEPFQNLVRLEPSQSLHARLLGELALKKGLHEIARAYFAQINFFKNRDKILLAEIECRLRSCEGSEILISQFPAQTTDAEKNRMLQILGQIEKTRGLLYFSTFQIQQMRKELLAKYPDLSSAPGMDDDCRSGLISKAD